MELVNRRGSVGVVVLIIILMVLLVGGAYYLGTHNAASNPATPAATTASTPAAQSDPYAGWQMYQNIAVGFQLKYPPIFTKPPTEVSEGSVFVATFIIPTPTSTIKTNPFEALSISVTPQTASQDITSDIQNYESGNNLGQPSACFSGLQIATTTIQGEPAAKISCSEAKADFGGSTLGSTESYDFYHNQEHYVIGLSGDASGSNTSDQVMASFSFLK